MNQRTISNQRPAESLLDQLAGEAALGINLSLDVHRHPHQQNLQAQRENRSPLHGPHERTTSSQKRTTPAEENASDDGVFVNRWLPRVFPVARQTIYYIELFI